MYIIYEQKQKSCLLFLLFYLILAFLLSVVLFFFRLPKFSSIVLGLVLIMDFLLIFNFSKLFFRITNEGLEFGFGIFKKRIKKEDIESVFISDSKYNFFNYGIGFGKDKSFSYIARKGGGVIVNSKRYKSVFVSLNNPEEALKVIKDNNYV